MTAPRSTATGDTTQLSAPPAAYEQFDESQTRREIERSFRSVDKRIDAIKDVILAQIVTDGIIRQNAPGDSFILTAGVPQALDMNTTLETIVPQRWSMPANGTLGYTGTEFPRLGLFFAYFEISPDANNRTFVVDILNNDVIGRTYEFQTGTSSLNYPVSISGVIDLPVGITELRLQITCTTSVTIQITEFLLEGADFFSASSFDFGDVTRAGNEVPIVTGLTPLRSLLNNVAQLVPAGVLDPLGANLNKPFAIGPLGDLATGYAQQRGSGMITIPSVNTWVAFDPVTTLNESSTNWTQPSDAALIIINDTKRLGVMKIIMILDTMAANQTFEFRTLIDGVPVSAMPFGIILQGNAPQEQAFGFDLLVAIGESEISFEVRNVTSAQDLVVMDYIMSASDNLARG